MSSDPKFELASIVTEGRTVRAYRCTCKYCGRDEKIPANQSLKLPGVVVQKKFQQRGWVFPKRLCRECQ